MFGTYFKGIVAGLLLALSMSVAYGMPYRAANYANSPVGLWTTIDDKTNQVRSIIRIWESNGVYYGTLEKIFKQPGDTGICSSCKGSFKNKPILGLTIIWGLKRTSDRVWSGGQILDPHNGNVYRVMLTLSNDGRSLRARGYIGFSVFGRTQNWYRRM
jgi:uncharacterized protein (DUF2147 family)